MNTLLVRTEVIGILFIFILGSVMHFVYNWSHKSPIVALFAPVNESVWEHLKLILWPTLIYSLYEYILFKDNININNFWTAKLLGIFVAMIFIIIFFYLYTAIVGHNILFVDILSFLLSIILSQLLSYSLINSKKLPNFVNNLSFVIILIIVVLFALFTFYPPHIQLFKDSSNNTYGI